VWALTSSDFLQRGSADSRGANRGEAHLSTADEGLLWHDPRMEADHRSLDRAFRITVTLKGLDGALEVIGGIVLLFVSPASIEHVVRFFTAHELAQDPHDFIARHLLHSASGLTRSATVYGGIYLLTHGVAKVVLVVLVLKDKLWAFPLMIALIGVFIVYQVYRLTYQVTFGLIFLTLFDLLVVWLTWREYRIKRSAREVASG